MNRSLVPNFFVTMSHFPFDDSEMSHIIEHSENMRYTDIRNCEVSECPSREEFEKDVI